jgi:hypothetical protein
MTEKTKPEKDLVFVGKRVQFRTGLNHQWRDAFWADVRDPTVAERHTLVDSGEYKILEDPQLRVQEHFYRDGRYLYSKQREQIKIRQDEVEADTAKVKNKEEYRARY